MDLLGHVPPPVAARAALWAARATARSSLRPCRGLRAARPAAVVVGGCGLAPPRRARPRGPALACGRHLAHLAPTIEGTSAMTYFTLHVFAQADHRSKGSS